MSETAKSLVKALLGAGGSLVLATQDETGPYCSLMAFAAAPDLSRIFMASPRDSRKWRNLLRNPQVSLMIDNRGEVGCENGPRIRALTVLGRFAETPSPSAEAEALAILGVRRPDLVAFFSKPDMGAVVVIPESFLLLDGVETAHWFSAAEIA